MKTRFRYPDLKAETDEKKEAIDKLLITVREFLSDWKKGDFDLPTLAIHDVHAIENALTEYELLSL